MGVVVETDDARLEISKGTGVSVNAAGDKVILGYRTEEDKKRGKDGLAMMALVPQDHVRYLYFQGDVKVIKHKEKPSAAGRSD